MMNSMAAIEHIRTALEADEARARSVRITLPGLSWQEPDEAPQAANDNTPAARWPLKRALAREDMLFGTPEDRARIERAAWGYLDIIDPRPDDWLPPAAPDAARAGLPFISRDPAELFGQEGRVDRTGRHRVLCRFLGPLARPWHAAVVENAEVSEIAPAGTTRRLAAKGGALRIRAAGLIVDGALHDLDFSPRQRDEIYAAAANDWWKIRYAG